MDWNQFTPYGIYNDKAIYFPASNLPMNLITGSSTSPPLVAKGRGAAPPRVRHRSCARRSASPGYYAGPTIHIVDPLALNDALLARLPAINDPAWHIGHNIRYIPEGYLETVRTGRNQIEDPNLATYYDSLSRVIKGPSGVASAGRRSTSSTPASSTTSSTETTTDIRSNRSTTSTSCSDFCSHRSAADIAHHGLDQASEFGQPTPLGIQGSPGGGANAESRLGSRIWGRSRRSSTRGML